MNNLRIWGLFLLICCGFTSFSQKVVYSKPEREDTRRLNFEIIGKIEGNYLIYKNIRNQNSISILNEKMEQVAKVPMDYLPTNDQIINVDFFTYPSFSYLIYQYRKKNIVYCDAVKIDGKGQKMGEINTLDTTHVKLSADSKIYTVLASEDKGKFMAFKINSKDKSNYILTTILFDKELNPLKYSRFNMPMQDRDDYIDEFHLANDGDLVFSKFTRKDNENLGSTQFVVKDAMADSYSVYNVNAKEIMLDEVHIKPDNTNGRIILSSFYYKQKRGNAEGVYVYVWDKKSKQTVVEKAVEFSEALRREAKGNSSMKAAFNDYFIKDIIVKSDGGFILNSEAIYTTSRGVAGSRWNSFYGSPFSRSFDYYNYSPFFSPFDRFGTDRWNQNTRYQADNVVIMSFDKAGEIEWNSVVTKEQFSDESDNTISYGIVNTGNQVHFLFNNMERRIEILSDVSLQPGGKIVRNPTLKNLDRGYEFMPKYAKQVNNREVIIPCFFRSYICFGKLEF